MRKLQLTDFWTPYMKSVANLSLQTSVKAVVFTAMGVPTFELP
jgi:hypothetical protein